ncbi:lectin like domain-containing protein [Methanobrevibacter sp.]|uniref:lectin like domain-containing protein n=1 Tax=Methanobrevibacter sp. TaxID=66852 RepID=UPI0038631131
MKFKSKYFVFVIVICILFSISTISASDNQSDVALSQNLISDEQIDISNDGLNEKLAAATTKSYDGFYEDIKDYNGTFDMKYDYKYSESDNKPQLVFNQSNVVINGNNHIIDGSNEAHGFIFKNDNANITINDLTFVNCNQAIKTHSGKITLNNVNFTKNFVKDTAFGEEEGVVTVDGDGDLILNNCNFNSNINSTLISTTYFDVAIYNSHFYNTQSVMAPLNINRRGLVIENSTFENLSSPYGGAINFKGDTLSVKNSVFKNLHVGYSGGAILAKFFPIFIDLSVNMDYRPSGDMLIENCEFLNVSSIHNGGVIYIDLDSGSDGIAKTLNISNCNFTDSSSGFGGVIADQGGFLNIINTNFVNSAADSLGGAIYTSWANLTLTNCNVINNSAESNAGAIYFDKGRLVIDKSNFTNNKVNAISSGKEAIIYANDVDATIKKSTFNNGGVAVYANFASSSNIQDVDSTGLFLMNNVDYIVSVENKGIKLNLTKNSIVVDKLPSRFDIRDWGWASPLKFQGDSLACWAFATAGALECTLLKATGNVYNISEDNVYNLQLKYYSEGDTRIDNIGFAYSGLGHSLSWYGIVMAQDDPFDERGMFSSVVQTENRIHLQDAMIILAGRNDTEDLLKRAIINYGAASVQYSIMPIDYNEADYTDEDLQPNHFVTLIGWDDNYPAENFRGTLGVMDGIPKRDGAWLIKDSESGNLSETEGVYMGEGGYIWISYDNPSFLAKDLSAIIPQAAAVAYIFENDIDYHVNYQTDLTGLTGFDGKYTCYSNEFTSKYTELIGAVGTYFNESGIDYSFDVYVNNKLVHSQKGVSEFAGFRTIVLNKYIPINKGDKFKVVFKSNALPYQAYSRQHYVSGMSMVSADGKSWKDITTQNRTVCLKVYTVKDDTKVINNKNIVVDYNGGKYFSVKVVTANGRAVGAGKIVKFKINKKTYSVKTDKNGIAKLKINLIPKKYTIKTTCNGKTYTNKVTVKQVLTTSKVTVKKTVKKFVLKAKLKINGKLVKGKTIKFKFKGKTYKAKTNKKGIAQVTINKKVIKKLKKGKTYKVKVIYLKDTIKSSVKVK